MFAEYLDDLRDLAEERMLSRANVHRPAVGGVQDETTGLQGSGWDEVETDLPFRLGGSRGGSGAVRTVTIGGAELTLAVRTGHLPAGTEVYDGDLIEVTQGDNAGTVWRVIEGDWADQQTALRVPIVATDRPTEWDA